MSTIQHYFQPIQSSALAHGSSVSIFDVALAHHQCVALPQTRQFNATHPANRGAASISSLTSSGNLVPSWESTMPVIVIGLCEALWPPASPGTPASGSNSGVGIGPNRTALMPSRVRLQRRLNAP